jgi:hypothetical protein
MIVCRFSCWSLYCRPSVIYLRIAISVSPSWSYSHLSINRSSDPWHVILKRRQCENLLQTFCETFKFNTCITTPTLKGIIGMVLFICRWRSCFLGMVYIILLITFRNRTQDWFPDTSSSSKKQDTGPGLWKDSLYSIS